MSPSEGETSPTSGPSAPQEEVVTGRVAQTTNNRMEMTAVIQGLLAIVKVQEASARVVPDSAFGVDGQVTESSAQGRHRSCPDHNATHPLPRSCAQIHSGSVTVISDSQYVIKGITEWVKGWMRNGWRTSQKKPVENQDLWQDLVAIVDTLGRQGLTLQWQWVRGHNGHADNERVDALAQQEARLAGR